MNIGKLISPIGVHLRNKTSKSQDIEDTDATEDRHQPISIPHEMNYHERSYFKESNELQISRKRKESQSQPLEKKQFKLEMLETELSEIEKMKNQFQMKKKGDCQGSIERIANRSIERHNLRPSGAPKIHTNTSEFSLQNEELKFGERTLKEETMTFKMRSPEVILLDHDSLFENDNISINPNNPVDKSYHDCKCEQVFLVFMNEARQKMSEISSKIAQIQQSNALFIEKQKEISEENEKIMKNIENFDRKRVELTKNQEEVKSQEDFGQILKQNFQNKELLSKRQEPDHFSSKKKNVNSSMKKQVINPKVQTLLHRLQLRIQKS